nr:SAM-dependent methyltransferase [Myxosarcina sp. GI1]
MNLDRIVPFGRSLDEYRQMFALTSQELASKKILGVGDGPASFNAEATQISACITSIDPIYQFSGAEIQRRFDAVVDNIITQVINSPNDWVWSYHKSPQALKTSRIRSLKTFLADYERGKRTGRYQVRALPKLEFSDLSFDLALCSHLLFLYSQQLDRTFHLESIRELLRVSREIRIFPLLTLNLELSPYLELVTLEFLDRGYDVAIEPVAYELQKGANSMLVLKHCE